MNKIIGPLFAVFVACAVGYAFSARKGPPLPATGIAVHNALLLDAQRAGGRLVAAGERGYLFVSDDEGQAWRRVPSGTEATLTGIAFVDGRLGLAVGHDAVILRSEDAGDSWQQVHAAPDQLRPLLDVAFIGPERAFAVGAYGAFLESTDGGKSWNERPIVEGDRHFNAIARLSGSSLLIAGEAGTLLRSSDGGNNWEALASPYAGSFFGVQPLPDGGVLVFGMRGKVFRSDDQGDSWQAVETGNENSLFGGATFNGQTVVLTGQNGVVLRSDDAGRTFIRQAIQGSRVQSAALGSVGGEALLFGEGGVTRVAAAKGSVK